MARRSYTTRLRSLLSPAEHRVFEKLNTPQKIQDYLDLLEINFEETGETLYSPRGVLKAQKVHCIEAALFAAASLAYHGRAPLLLDMQTVDDDEDHVVTLFKENNLWGAISKTNHPVLRWRDPLYRSVRELAMSYFHEYFKEYSPTRIRKTMRAYSKPFNLRQYAPERWVTAKERLYWLAEELDDSPHFPVAPKKALSTLRSPSQLEVIATRAVEWKKMKK